MQRWQDEFAKHPIHATIQILEDSASAKHTISEPLLTSERARLLKVIGFIKRVVGDLDPDVTPTDVLSALNNTLTQSGVTNSLLAFATTGDANNLVNANVQINAAIGYVYQLNASKGIRSIRQVDTEVATKELEKFIARVDRESSRIMEISQNVA